MRDITHTFKDICIVYVVYFMELETVFIHKILKLQSYRFICRLSTQYNLLLTSSDLNKFRVQITKQSLSD